MKNKEWLKEQLSYLQDGVGESFNDYSKGLNAAYNTLELLINQLDEPEQEKVVVNEIMAGHIENCKNLKLTLSDSLHLVVPGDKQEEVLFARAWLDGYTIEKVKRYRVELPDTESNAFNNLLGLMRTGDDRIVICKIKLSTFLHSENVRFTEQEIKRNHEYLWRFAEEVTDNV